MSNQSKIERLSGLLEATSVEAIRGACKNLIKWWKENSEFVTRADDEVIPTVSYGMPILKVWWGKNLWIGAQPESGVRYSYTLSLNEVGLGVISEAKSLKELREAAKRLDPQMDLERIIKGDLKELRELVNAEQKGITRLKDLSYDEHLESDKWIRRVNRIIEDLISNDPLSSADLISAVIQQLTLETGRADKAQVRRFILEGYRDQFRSKPQRMNRNGDFKITLDAAKGKEYWAKVYKA